MDIKVVEGKNGQLFLGGADSNNVLGQITGQVMLSGFSLQCLLDNYKSRRRLASKYGHVAAFLICPEVHVIRREFLPDYVTVSDYRPVKVLLKHLPEDDVIYPSIELRNSDLFDFSGYDLNDSHWNKRGAYQAYLRVMDFCNQNFRLKGVNERVTFYPVSRAGDLGNKFQPERRSTSFNVSIANSAAKRTFHNGIENHGSVQIFENLSAPNGVCLVFGTSFSDYYLEFLAESFHKVVFAYSTIVDEAIVSMCSPDLVIYEMPERFLFQPLSDNSFLPVTINFLKKCILYADYVGDIYADGICGVGKYFCDVKKYLVNGANDNCDLSEDLCLLVELLKANPVIADALLSNVFDAKLAELIYAEIDNKRISVEFISKYKGPITCIARLRAIIKNNPSGDHSKEIMRYVSLYGVNDDLTYLLKYIKKSI